MLNFAPPDADLWGRNGQRNEMDISNNYWGKGKVMKEAAVQIPVYYSRFSRETKWIGYVSGGGKAGREEKRERKWEINFKELAQAVVGTDMFQIHRASEQQVEVQVRADVAVLSLKAGNSGRFSLQLSRGRIPSWEIWVFALKAFSWVDEAYPYYGDQSTVLKANWLYILITPKKYFYNHIWTNAWPNNCAPWSTQGDT